MVDWLDEDRDTGSPLNEPIELARGNESRLGVGLFEVVDWVVDESGCVLLLWLLIVIVEVAIVN